MKSSPKWQPLMIGGAFNPRVQSAARNASGAYAIRRASDHEVLYVGESSRGALWKTLLRHFHGVESFKAVREGFVVSSGDGYEVALQVTSRGARPRASSARAKGAKRTDADQRAMAAQARWIATLKPTKNKDDGTADAVAQELRAVRARQEEEERDAGAFGSLLNPGDERDDAWVAAQREALKKWRVEDLRDWARWNDPNGEWDDASKEDLVAVIGGVVDENRETPAEIRSLSRRNPAPQGALSELGNLTRLEPTRGKAFRWSLREAPSLAYDDAGRLFIVYTGKIVRTSTPAEMREYARTHWGKAGTGKVRDGGIAVGPFVRLGAAKSITYTTKKGFDSELVDYVHPFGEGASIRGFVPPDIVEHECVGGCGSRCAARGAIALHGGSYRVTSRGIVG